jgi:hypothetical protein
MGLTMTTPGGRVAQAVIEVHGLRVGGRVVELEPVVGR